jgi:hypothetical protein
VAQAGRLAVSDRVRLDRRYLAGSTATLPALGVGRLHQLAHLLDRQPVFVCQLIKPLLADRFVSCVRRVCH